MKANLNFEKTVSMTVALQGRPFEKRSCPDQYVGTLTEIVGQKDFPRRTPAASRPDIPCLLLILESPHIDEFGADPGPAKGFTGEMLRNHLPDAYDMPDLESYGLVLMNAIQFQCSLGSNTAVYRDRVFRSVWASGGKENFQDRLDACFKPGDLVMNCCTKGNDFEVNPPLRSLVEAAIQQRRPEIKTIKRMHPAAWRNPNWIGKAWRYQESFE